MTGGGEWVPESRRWSAWVLELGEAKLILPENIALLQDVELDSIAVQAQPQIPGPESNKSAHLLTETPGRFSKRLLCKFNAWKD